MPKTYDDPNAQLLFSWANYKLKRADVEEMEDVATGFNDGLKLAVVVEACTREKIKKLSHKDGMILAMKLDNISKCFTLMDKHGVDIRGIAPANIQAGDEKLIFGLLYKLMTKLDVVGLDEMFRWCEAVCEGQLDFPIDSIERFQDGRIFAAIANAAHRGAFDVPGMSEANAVDNLAQAFAAIQEYLDVPSALDPAVVSNSPDEVHVLAYLGMIKSAYASHLESKKTEAKLGWKKEGLRASRMAEDAEEEAASAAAAEERRRKEQAEAAMAAAAEVEAAAGAAREAEAAAAAKAAAAKVPEPKATIAELPHPKFTVRPHEKVDPNAGFFSHIEVRVIESKNLKNMESFGKMSPYAVVWVNFEPHEKCTSVAQRGGVNPKWNELLVWKAKGEIKNLRMKVIVWDKETFGFDDYVGGGDVGAHHMTKGKPIEKWVKITQHTQAAGAVLLQVTLK